MFGKGALGVPRRPANVGAQKKNKKKREAGPGKSPQSSESGYPRRRK